MEITEVGTSPRDPATSRLQRASREFEAMILKSLLDAGSEEFLGLPGSKDTANHSYESLAREAIANALAARGGLGIGRMIVHSLTHTKVGGTPEVTTRPTGGHNRS